MQKVAVLGATGFTGEKLVELLAKHPNVEISCLTSRTQEPIAYSKMFPKYAGVVDSLCEQIDLKKVVNKADFFFLSLPHTVSMQYVPELLAAGKKVVDLSADYRLKNISLYEQYYKVAHQDKSGLLQAVYGLPEFNKEAIAKTNLVANPGCYPTAVLLALLPLIKAGIIEGPIIVDAKSSITGAGRKAVIDYHYSNISNNIWAYKAFNHQHVPEMTEITKELTGKDIDLRFIPQVIGVDSGIYATIHCQFVKVVLQEQLGEIYNSVYKNCPFVRVKDHLVKLSEVVGTNFCDIGFVVNQEKKCAVIACAIDNLVKGAAGQAIQNMNIMFGWQESLGLK